MRWYVMGMDPEPEEEDIEEGGGGGGGNMYGSFRSKEEEEEDSSVGEEEEWGEYNLASPKSMRVSWEWRMRMWWSLKSE